VVPIRPAVKLYAISDLHLRYEVNRRALVELPPHPDDWLILAGDVGDAEEHLRWAFRILGKRFARLLWVPGNHELWTLPAGAPGLRGVAKYERLVEVCRDHGVLTPEDPFEPWPGPLPPGLPGALLAPLFVLYDYSFRPSEVPPEEAVAWAAEHEVMATDEALLHPDPHPSKAAWCAARCALTEPRLAAAAARAPLILINHFPLKERHAVLPAIPRFRIWCGTRRTEAWPERFRAHAVVYGHLHIRASRREDGVRYEEVSLGYPRNWEPHRGVVPYLREILPGSGSKAS
jgi:3',5'-cyclic AMP phosphodiesterase CpdA